MSIRSHAQRINSFNASATPSNPIDFREDFVNSTAVYAANTDETVSQIMQRLDQLQSKIGANEQQAAAAPVAARASPAARSTAATGGDIHARVSNLESIHEDTLRALGSKLDVVERKLNDQREVESLMGQISSKFTRIESQLNAAKESEGLMSQVANKFSAVESRLQSATQLSDRVAQLESRLESHADLHSRMTRLESRIGSHTDLHTRINRLESSMAPDPEQERLISRISAKLDSLERARPLAAPMVDDHHHQSDAFLGAQVETNHEREERINYLQNRIEKLKELRSRYEMEEAVQ